jgi:hypothetical protein
MTVRHRIDHDHDDAEPPDELGHLSSVGPARHDAIVGTVDHAQHAHEEGLPPIYIADPDDHRECPDTPPTGTALELLQSAGGFLISGSDLAELLSD